MKDHKRFFLGVLAIVDIAYHGGSQPVRSGDIVRRHHIAKRHLEQLLGQLATSRILQSIRGPKGGYILGRERRRISLLDIANALHPSHTGTEPPSLFCNDIDTSPIVSQSLMPLHQVLEKKYADILAHITIDDICMQVKNKGITQESLHNLDWTI